MSVTEYKNIECKYRIDKLDNVVYLVPENALRNIHIDAGEAYVDNIPFEPLRIDCYNIALSDTDEFDERYKFTHQLTFSVNGYANHNTLDGNYYAIVRSVDNEYWLVNPMFPCKVTYTYRLGYMENHTDFTLSTISNHPTLRIHGMNQGKPFICHDYFLNSFDRLFLNEKRYSTHVGSDIHYTNDGFKEVVYDKKSATFTETFDGKNVSHSIQFNIKFDDYKDSWHYNLLEFTDNLYSAVITSTKGEYVLCGFHFGLQPSYTVTSNGESTPDYIQINLVDMHDNGDLITYITGGTISPITDTVFKFTLEYDAWECVSDGYAQYLLKKEVDALDNPTGNYMCLSGYTEQFSFLGDKLVGTFDETDTFFQPQCKIGECKLYTSLTSPVKMWAQQCKSFSVKADSDWSITNNASYLQFTPSSGEADTEYTVQLCNFREQSAATVTTSFTINYCSTSSTYNVQIGKGSGCFYGGDEFNITPDAQYVVVPVECCVSAVSETTSALTNIQIFDNYIRVYVPQNLGESARTFTLNVTLCDESGEIVTINQANGYERWVTEGYTCVGKLKCEVQRKYTGTTSGDINTWTEVVRTYGCIPSSECGGSMTRWIDTEDTVCYEGRKYIVQIEQVKPSTDSPWINTGNQRRGDETPDSPAECSGTTLEEWRVDTSEYICDDTTKYEMMRLYVSYDSGTTWTATDTTKKGVVIEHDSEDCGYVPPSGETYYEWRIEGTQCDGFNLYNWEQKYISSDGNTWSPTGTYRYGSLIEQNSTQCGYVPPILYEYQWVLSSGTTCIGYDKYYLYKKQQRPSGSSDTWVDVVPTTTSVDGSGTETPVMAQSASTDCGYVPEYDPIYKWVTISINVDYICDGLDKYYKQQRYVSYDNGSTWIPMAEYRKGSRYEQNSADCGYSLVYDWFVVEDEYTCSGCTKYQKTQKYVSINGGTTWNPVSPAEYGLGDVIELGSEDCGCSTQYRWYTLPTTEYICSGTTKYYKQVYQVSYDNGVNWQNVIPEQYRASGIIEQNSYDCGYGIQIERWVNGYMCDDCVTYKLITVTSADSVTNVECDSSTTISSGDITNRTSLTSVTIGNCITEIGTGAFSGCTLLDNVRIPSSISTIGIRAFHGCSSLWDASIPDSVTSIGYAAFSGCTQLNFINLPNHLNEIGHYAFRDCLNFRSINIPSTLRRITIGCFYNCDGLGDIILPSSINEINDDAFRDCSGLYNVILYSVTPPALGTNVFTNANSNLKIYVPAQSVDSYKSASGWSDYASKIYPITT